MAIASVAAFVETLSQYRLLEPAQLDELTRAPLPRFPAAKALAQELIRRGWLTPYQVNRLFQGRGHDLVLGQYLLLERLGEGGMGQVFKARHLRMGRTVALKTIRQERLENSGAVRRFEHEIRAAAQLNHPNVVRAFDAGQVGDTHFFTMEYVEGNDLARLVETQGPLPVAQACDCIRQAALGLQHAHECGMIHRDIKPANLLVAARDGTVKILDMGLARLAVHPGQSSSSSTLTLEGAIMGTPDFLAPEQAQQSHHVDIRADLYSLGCTFYFLLTGQVPFPGGSMAEKLVKHHYDQPQPVEQLRPELLAGVAAIVRKLMAKRPEDRYQAPAELAFTLAAVLNPTAVAVTARPVSPPAGAAKAPVVVSPWSALLDSASEDAAGSGDPRRAQDSMRQRRSATAARQRWLWLGVGGLLLAVLVGFLVMRPLDGDDPSQDEPRPRPVAKKPKPKPKPLKKYLTNSLGMTLVRIPAGKFLMGSPASEPGRLPHEGPQHEVAITKSFYMGIHEVTVGQFRTFAQATGYRTDGEKGGRGAIRFFGKGVWARDPQCTWRKPGWKLVDEYPVVCVSWNDAKAFCQWLSKREGQVYRLPTEAEWEYACRTGKTTAYHFGASLFPQQANATPRPGGAPVVRVGSYPPNAFGLYEMHGNVWEWCLDWYEAHSYRSDPVTDPTGPGAAPPVCGVAAVGARAASCRCATRQVCGPADGVSDLGFRVVCTDLAVPQVFADFESGTYGKWKKTGDAFGARPATGAWPGQGKVVGFGGKYLVNTFIRRDLATGTLTSPAFTIQRPFVNFRIGGGNFAGKTCINLLAHGKVVRTATGKNREMLEWESWDVRSLRGQRTILQIVDRETRPWGHILLDDIEFADAPAKDDPSR